MAAAACAWALIAAPDEDAGDRARATQNERGDAELLDPAENPLAPRGLLASQSEAGDDRGGIARDGLGPLHDRCTCAHNSSNSSLSYETLAV